MSRPRVLHVFKTAAPENLGGIPTVMQSISRGLSDRFDFGFLIASNKGARYFEPHLGFPVTTVRHFGHLLSMPIAPTFPLHLRRMASRYDIVALHAPFPLADLAGYLGAHRRTPLVVHWHSEIVRQTMFKMLYASPISRSLAGARAIIVGGEPLLDSSGFLRHVREKCHVIPFGVDADHWNRLSDEDRDYVRRVRAEHPRLVLAVGRLVSYKGLHVLIEAMERIDGELWIVGKGPLNAFLGQRAAAGTAVGRIRFLGEVPQANLRRLYHAVRVLSLPSISIAEAFGLVQLEAMACGLPVVNTRLDTMVPHVARDMHEGLTVPPDNPVALAAAIGRILDDPQLRDHLGQSARARAASSFTESAFLESVASVYDGVLCGRGDRSRALAAGRESVFAKSLAEQRQWSRAARAE